MHSLLITGSTGNVGSAVIESLNTHQSRKARFNIIAGVSGRSGCPGDDPQIDCRLCPYGDREKILQALEGIDSVFLMIPFGDKMIEWARQFVQCALEKDVKFIVRLSGLAASLESKSAMGRLQGGIDEAVKQSGIDYCILRCNSFMQNFSRMYRPMIQRGKLGLAHGDARISFIDTGDIGSIAAKVLLCPENYTASTLDLHGPQALSNEEVVECIRRVTGRDLQYIAISGEKAREGYLRAKMEDWEIDVFSSLDSYFRDGYGLGSGDLVEQILKRKGGDFRSFADKNRDLWL